MQLVTMLHKSQEAEASHVRLVLASASPRRRELLSFLEIPFTIVATSAEETDTSSPADIVAALPSCSLPLEHHPSLVAWRKVRAAAQLSDAPVVLGADTTVVLENHILNKPDDEAVAYAMLERLSGQTHQVYTGLCVCNCRKTASFSFDLVMSEVRFKTLDPDDITAYIATGEPMDKAGAYGIQGFGASLVSSVEGSFTSVVGLPLETTRNLLTAAGISGLRDSTSAYEAWLQSIGKEPMPCPPTLP